MMEMYCFVTVGVLILLVTSINGQCEIKDDNGGPLQFDRFTPQSLGKFPKTVKDGEQLNGIHMQEVQFLSVTENTCADFLDIMNEETIVYVTAKNFANWDNAGDPNGKCTFFITFDATDPASCGFSSIRVNFNYTVEDVNTKPPEFNQLSYSFNVSIHPHDSNYFTNLNNSGAASAAPWFGLDWCARCVNPNCGSRFQHKKCCIHP